jgi:hypothetical protein
MNHSSPTALFAPDQSDAPSKPSGSCCSATAARIHPNSRVAMVVTTAIVFILIGMSLLFGFANGFSGFANQAALYVQAPADEIAVASGLYRAFAYFGAIFSSSLIGIAFGSAATDAGFHVVAFVIVGIGVRHPADDHPRQEDPLANQ